uniref:HTH cro/C1-type domain-containing protein n=1 Tax=viral metagenome TaxID=1070528 RepID=A0A6C0EIF8_9ZZZZ
MDNTDYHNRTITIGKRHTSSYKETEIKVKDSSNNKLSTNSLKIEKDFEAGKSLKTWGTVYGKAVTQARCKLPTKTSQTGLAKQLQVKPDIVKEIENGKGLYNDQLANKLFRILKVKRNP